ncbi:MAG: 5-oxoprolinase subunit PxpB [Oscillochloris sp.]|nr:5-oxoprolinase subunit PxpB [Oscillochloris sp.]
MSWICSPLGDAALLLEARPDQDNPNQFALQLAAELEASPPAWLRAVVPAIASLLICFDPLAISHSDVESQIRSILEQHRPSDLDGGRLMRIPVRYGGADGLDIEEVAHALDMTTHELIRLHCAQPYRVMMIGFAPGFPYIGPLPAKLHIPRRATPRSAVPAGAVAIAAGLSGIYPGRLPGGWHLIGHTDLRLFDPYASRPTTLAPGDLVQFVGV